MLPALPELLPDARCALAAKDLGALLSKPDLALMDLRSNAEFQAFHIANAINLTPAELHAKPYWRNKKVVLIGNGKGERELYGECTRLKQAGYSQVRVLLGGMPHWLAQQQAVAGRPPSVAQLSRISAGELWLEGHNADTLILLSQEHAAMQKELAHSVILPKTAPQAMPQAIKAVIERRRKETKNAPLLAVVLAAGSSSDEQIARWQQALLPLPLLVYADNADLFKRHMVQQKLTWLAHARGPKQPVCGNP